MYLLSLNEGLYPESSGGPSISSPGWTVTLMVICLFFYRQQQSPDALESSQLEEEVDELSLIDHSEIMARLTLKQEVGACRVCFQTLWFILYGNLCAQARRQLLFDRKN